MIIEDYLFPDDLLYDKRHFWAKVEGDVVTMGMTDYAVKSAGDLVFVEPVEPGKKTVQDRPFMSVESGKWVGRVYAPVSGSVIEFNEELEFDPTLVNEDPYGEGWLAKLKMDDPAELDNLMGADTVGDWFVPELNRLRKLEAKKTGGQ